jgi:hypothetical protein
MSSATATLNIRRGDWILTFTGVEFWPMDPRLDEIRIEDIAHALSMQCRFSGHIKKFYSVAEHSIRVAELVSTENKLAALLHDASEAYLVDLPSPIKNYSEIGRHYKIAEQALMETIAKRFSFVLNLPEVETADKQMLCIEARDLCSTNSWWNKYSSVLTGKERSVEIPMLQQEAEDLFLQAFKVFRAKV